MKKANNFYGKKHKVAYTDGHIRSKDWTGSQLGWVTVLKHVGFNYQFTSVYLCRDLFGNEFFCCSNRFGKEGFLHRARTPESQVLVKKLNGVYYSMLERCYSPKHPARKWYYDKSVTVADEWLGNEGRINFIWWASQHGYKPGLTLDKREGIYSPKTCRWISAEDNGRFKNSTILNWDKVRAIRQDYSKNSDSINGFCRTSAAKYGSKPGNIRNIIRNKSWVENNG